MLKLPPSSSSRNAQKGGLTIIMALVLVSVLGAATFSLSRNVIRDLSMSGITIQGEKAAAAADAGLDWVLIWGQGHLDDAAYTNAGPAGGQKTLVSGINSAMLGINTGDPITILGASDSTMTVNGTAAAATQNFDVELRFLGVGWGNAPIGGAGGSSDNNPASGNKKGGVGTSTPVGWRALVTGNATPVSTSLIYQARRELVATYPY